MARQDEAGVVKTGDDDADRTGALRNKRCDEIRNVMLERANMPAAKEGTATKKTILATDQTSSAYKRFLA